MSDFTGLLPENDKQKADRKAMLLPMPPCAPGDLVEETLWEEFPPHITVDMQGPLSACAGYAESHAYEAAVYGQTGLKIDVSGVYSYINGQREGGNLGSDSGAFLFGVLAAAKKYGHCRSDLAPNTGRYYTQIGQSAYEDGKKNLTTASVDLERGGYDALRLLLGQQMGGAVFAVGWPLRFEADGDVHEYVPGRFGHAMALVGLSSRKDPDGRPWPWAANSHPTRSKYRISPRAIDAIVRLDDWGMYGILSQSTPVPRVDWRKSNHLMA